MDADAIYLGKRISRENFRAYIYGADGARKLVDSWDAFTKHMETGLWFDSLDKVPAPEVVVEKPKRVRKPAAKPVTAVEILEADEGVEIVDDEPLDDGFLPKEG